MPTTKTFQNFSPARLGAKMSVVDGVGTLMELGMDDRHLLTHCHKNTNTNTQIHKHTHTNTKTHKYKHTHTQIHKYTDGAEPGMDDRHLLTHCKCKQMQTQMQTQTHKPTATNTNTNSNTNTQTDCPINSPIEFLLCSVFPIHKVSFKHCDYQMMKVKGNFQKLS